MIFNQEEFDIRFEWGEHGVALLAPVSQVVIIVDVLSFSTSVEIAVNRGAVVFPYPWKDEKASVYAASIHAELADPQRTPGKHSLSPASLTHIPPGMRLVLPSPNGATLALSAHPKPVIAGCLRNARAVALIAQRYGPKIAVIAAGERWRDDHSLRPSVEDLIGAGAIISALHGSRSPEAAAAEAAFQSAKANLGERLTHCSSGKELVERGYPEDVQLASQLNTSGTVPVLKDGAFVGVKTQADIRGWY